jgi:NADH-quinone oxidoreductase subunit L
LAVVGGFIGIPEVFAKDSHWLEHYLSPIFAGSNALVEAHAINHSQELLMMGVVTALVLVTIAFTWNKFSKYEATTTEETGLGKILENKWYVDELYNAIIVNPLNAFSAFLKNVIEKSGIDGAVNGIGKLVNYSSRQLRLVQSGQVGAYILMMVLSMIVILFIWINDATIINIINKLF